MQTTISAGAWSRWQAICTRVPKADTSTHLASASTLHRAAPASLLHQWELHRGSVADHNQCRCLVGAASTLMPSANDSDELAPCIRLHLAPCSTRKLAPSVRASWRLRCRPQSVQVRGRGGKQSAPECQEAKTSTHLESASTSHRGSAVASLLYQSELHGSSVADHNQCRCVVAAASTLMLSANDSDEHAPCVCLHLAPWSTVASLLHQSELNRGSVAAHNHCMCLVGAASNLHLSARRQR